MVRFVSIRNSRFRLLAISDVNSAGRPPFLRVPPPEPAYGTHDAWLQPLP